MSFSQLYVLGHGFKWYKIPLFECNGVKNQHCNRACLEHTWWDTCCLCWQSCHRRWRGRPRGRRLSSAAEDQERRVLHADSAKVKDWQRQRPAAPARPQVLHQRALLQPQGGLKRAHVPYNHSVLGAVVPAGVQGPACPVPSRSRLTVQSQGEVIHQPLQCVLAFSRFQLEAFP